MEGTPRGEHDVAQIFTSNGRRVVCGLAGYNVVFAQEITSDAKELNQGANTIWMFAAFLVFFMQAGFAFLGAGLIRGRNTANYMTKSFMDFAMASLSFWAFGFALMWGTSALGIADLGHQNVRNYDGSWTEWGSIVNAPIEKP